MYFHIYKRFKIYKFFREYRRLWKIIQLKFLWPYVTSNSLSPSTSILFKRQHLSCLTFDHRYISLHETFSPFSSKFDFLFCDHSHKRNIILLQYLMVIGNGIDSSITSSDSFSFVRYTNLIRFKPINLIAVGNWMFITYHKNHISTVLLRLQRTM